MNAPRILLADDEPLLLAELRGTLATLWPEAEVVALATDGAQALRMARELEPDIAFLDIRMPGLSGLEVARTFGAHIHTVFVTAYQDHALAAFDEGAVDYLLKPIDPARLARAIERLRTRMGTRPHDLARLVQQLAPKKAPPAWLQASIGSTIHFIDLKDVIYFASEFKYTRVVTDQMEAHIRMPLKELAEQLEEAGFWQIHRGYVVAIRQIAAVSRAADGAMWLSLRGHASRLPVSQRFQYRFKGM